MIGIYIFVSLEEGRERGWDIGIRNYMWREEGKGYYCLIKELEGKMVGKIEFIIGKFVK